MLIAAFVSSETIDGPWRYAYSQSLLPLEKLISPELHSWQLLHLKLAVILPSEIPEPSKRETFAASLRVGMECSGAFRGDRVTFVPSAELYMRNMLAFVIVVPCARATQEYVVGADN